LELYEMDVKKSTRVMRCERCGMLHFYKKDIVGKWRLFRAAKSELASR
jgi:predicted nucleic-acid-binding Zn-ribbon protein